MMEYLLLGLSAILVNNIILTRFLGICPLLGVSKKSNSAYGMAVAVLFVVFMSSLISYSLYFFVLVPLQIEFLRLVAFILIIASFVQFVEMFLKRFLPSLYKSLGIFLPLITTNCVVLAVALDVIMVSGGQASYNFLQMMVYSLGTAVGYGFILIIFSYIQERLTTNKAIPTAFKGSAIALVTLGLMVIAFLGFGGMI